MSRLQHVLSVGSRAFPDAALASADVGKYYNVMESGIVNFVIEIKAIEEQDGWVVELALKDFSSPGMTEYNFHDLRRLRGGIGETVYTNMMSFIKDGETRWEIDRQHFACGTGSLSYTITAKYTGKAETAREALSSINIELDLENAASIKNLLDQLLKNEEELSYVYDQVTNSAVFAQVKVTGTVGAEEMARQERLKEEEEMRREALLEKAAREARELQEQRKE
tara:strand:+ start:154 stop:825 length:672 start_codon:yes stop_codon:yes gene_type:complete